MTGRTPLQVHFDNQPVMVATTVILAFEDRIERLVHEGYAYTSPEIRNVIRAADLLGVEIHPIALTETELAQMRAENASIQAAEESYCSARGPHYHGDREVNNPV